MPFAEHLISEKKINASAIPSPNFLYGSSMDKELKINALVI